MKKLIEAWEKSKKNAQFQSELEKKRKHKIEMILSLKQKIKMENLYTKQELEEIIDSIIELQDEDLRDDLGWITEVKCSRMTKDELFMQYISTVATWFLYLSIYEKKEDYELCSKINKAIQIERGEFEDILITKYGEVSSEDEDYLDEINKQYMEEFRK